MKSDTGRILIVDDEPNVRLVFRTALEAAGYNVEEAEDGDTALDRLEWSPADLILLDLKMPGIGGMETLQRLREAGNDVPVVIVTAHGSIPDAVAAMRLGAIDFLSKPLRPEALRKVVGDVVRRSAAPHHPGTRPCGGAADRCRGHGARLGPDRGQAGLEPSRVRPRREPA